MSEIQKAYVRFQNYVKKHKYWVLCAGCNEIMILKDYENHCKTRHGLDHLTCCVFCEGRTSWPQHQKMQMGDHLYVCVQSFVVRSRQAPPPIVSNVNIVLPSSSPRNILPGTILPGPSTIPLTEWTPLPLRLPNKSVTPDSLFCSKSCYEFRSCSNQNTFSSNWSDHDWNVAGIRYLEESLFESNPERLDFTEADVMRRMGLESKPAEKAKWLALLNPLRFDERSGLGDAHLWIKRFLYSSWTANHYTWYHLCVRAGCMKSFVEAVEDLNIVAVPNWCVCDGGIGFGDRTLQATTHHRHLIVAVKNQKAFSRALKKNVEYRASGEPPERGFKKYYRKEIKDGNHFVNALAYVSLPSSKCRCKKVLGTKHEEEWNVPFWDYEKRRRRHHHGHYLIRSEIHWHARWWMFLLIPGDGLDRFARFSIGSRNVYGMKSRRREGTRWMLSAADEFHVKNCVVRFDPPNLRIDTQHPIEDLERYIDSFFGNLFGPPLYDGKKPFVYWFGGKKYPVKWMETPTFENDSAFQEWHVTRKINTLLNLGEGDSLFSMSRNMVRHANALEELKKDCEKVMSDEICKLRSSHDEIYRGLRREIEIEKEKYLNSQFEYDRLKQENEKEKSKYLISKEILLEFVKNRVSELEIDLKMCRQEHKESEMKRQSLQEENERKLQDYKVQLQTLRDKLYGKKRTRIN